MVQARSAKQPAAADVDLTIRLHRNIISDLPEKLEALAKTKADAALRQKLVACADVFRSWLKAPDVWINCTRLEGRWRGLVAIAREAKADSFATVLERRLLALDVQREDERERAAREAGWKREADALRERERVEAKAAQATAE